MSTEENRLTVNRYRVTIEDDLGKTVYVVGVLDSMNDPSWVMMKVGGDPSFRFPVNGTMKVEFINRV